MSEPRDPPPEPAGGRRFPCRGCGAGLEFSPGADRLACPYCGASQPLPATAEEVDEHSYEAWLAAPLKPLQRLAAHRVRCQGCGASTETDALAVRCPFCAAPLVVDDAAEDLITPEAVLPFHVRRAEALEGLRRWIASRWFAPSDLKRSAADEGILGVYLPFWTFDAYTRSFYAGERGEHYWVTESYTVNVGGRTEVRTRQVVRTRWFPASGRVERWFDDVLVPAMRSLPARDLDALRPWDLPSARPYQREVLAGFQAARYEIDPKGGFDEARRRMEPVIRQDCRNDIGGDEQRLHHVRTSWSGVAFKLVLLPVWVAAYRFRDRSYRVFVNARTGEVLGRRPWSPAKVAGLILLLLLLAAAVAAALHHLRG